jgi:hypothetical protein
METPPMKRIVLVLGSAASLLLSTSAMAAPAKKSSEASCTCSDHKKGHAAHSRKTKGVCPECGMTDCTCDHKECASCEHCQAEKAEGKKGSCSCDAHEKTAAPETKDTTK